VTVLRVDAAGVRRFAVAPAGLVDTLALDETDRVLLFYLAQDGNERGQRAVRVDTTSGAVERLELMPADELPPLDHPALVRCGREPWLAAEVVLSEGVDSGTARAESAVIALPAACLIRPSRAPVPPR
jgi:hypothetical protein